MESSNEDKNSIYKFTKNWVSISLDKSLERRTFPFYHLWEGSTHNYNYDRSSIGEFIVTDSSTKLFLQKCIVNHVYIDFVPY